MKKPETNAEAISERAKAQYVSTICRPDLAAPSQLIASRVNKRIPDAVHDVKALVKYCNRTASLGLSFVKIDLSTARINLFTDAAFANGENLTSQIGFLVILSDGSNAANILHYGSSKCKRVTRSVLAAELMALVHGFDQAFVIQHTLHEILGRNLPIDAYVDSRTAFNFVAKNADTMEKRLQIDANALRQSLQQGELRSIGWIPGTENPADAFTRKCLPSENHPLIRLMKSNKLEVKRTGWTDMGASSTQKEKQ